MASSIEEGLRLFRGNKIEAAARVFSDILAEDTSDTAAVYHLGICRFRQKRFQEAEKLFRSVTALTLKHPEAWYYLGLALERQNKPRDAKVAFEIALSQNPNFVEAQKKLEKQEPSGQTPTKHPNTNETTIENELRAGGAVKGLWTEKRSELSYYVSKITMFVLTLLIAASLLAGLGLVIGRGIGGIFVVVGPAIGLLMGLGTAISSAGSITRTK